jgi:hypothetical protein
MGAEKLEPKIDYDALEQQRAELLQSQLKIQLRAREAGKSASLRRIVLRYVVEAKYKDAAAVIDEYLEMKKMFPSLRSRCNTHAQHAKELINAVRAKRNFPNMQHLSMAKQQEVLDHALNHFEELKYTIKTIEHLVKDEAVKDIRSTVMIIRTLCWVVCAVLLTVFALEFSDSLMQPFLIVFHDFAKNSYEFAAKFIPFL